MRKYLFIVIILLNINFVAFSQLQKYSLSRQDSATITKFNEKAIEFQQTNHKREESGMYNNIASLYWEHNHFDEAINYYKKSLSLNENLDNENAIAMINSNLALILADQKKYDEALKYFEITLSTREANNEVIGIISAHINMSVVLNNLKKYDEAIDHLTKALDYAREMNDAKQMTSCYGMLSETYEKAGNSEKSMYYYELYKSFHEMVQDKRIIKSTEELENQRLKTEIAEVNTEKKALELLYKNIQLRKTEDELDSSIVAGDSLLSNLNKKELIVEVLKHKAEIVELENEKKLQKKRKAIRLISIAIGFLLIIALLLIFITLKIRKKNRTLNQQNAEILQNREEIRTQNEQLNRAYSQIDKAHQKITASINYSKFIQTAMLALIATNFTKPQKKYNHTKK